MDSGRGGATLRDSFLASDVAEKNETSRNTNNSSRATSLAGLTLAAVLNDERTSPIVHDHIHSQSHSSNNHIVRTLLDIIRNEETLSNPNTHFVGRNTWRTFRDRLFLKRLATGSHWTSSVPVPQSDIDVPGVRTMNRNTLRNSLRSNSMGRAGSFNAGHTIESVPLDEFVMRDNVEDGEMLRGSGNGSMRLSAALAAEREETRRRLSRELVREEDAVEDVFAAEGEGGVREDEGDGEGNEPVNVAQPAQQPLRMSLMDLLEETDRQAGIEGPTYRIDDGVDEEDEEEEEEVEEVKGGGLEKGEYSCCVCMVRHKGAAFIPCGHTFCRLCSRELWVQRGNCPLCNSFILEILDIF